MRYQKRKTIQLRKNGGKKKINKKLRIVSVINFVIFIIGILYNNADMLIYAVLPIPVAVIVVSVGLWKTRSNNHN